MSAFVQIGYNKIMRKATGMSVKVYDSSDVEVDLGPNDLPVQNLFYGGSTIYWRNSDSEEIAKSVFVLRLPSNVDAETIDHIAIRGLNLMFAFNSGDISITIEGTNNDLMDWETIVSKSGIMASDLVGPFLEDYILTFPESAAYRDFQITIISDNETRHRLRKLYIGKLFTFSGKSPYYPYTPGYEPNGNPFTSDSGARFKTSRGRRARALQFSWRGITDADRIEFDKEIRQYLTDYPIFLYEPSESDHSPLNNDTLVFGWGEGEIGTKDWKNNNQITLSFSEDIVG